MALGNTKTGDGSGYIKSHTPRRHSQSNDACGACLYLLSHCLHNESSTISYSKSYLFYYLSFVMNAVQRLIPSQMPTWFPKLSRWSHRCRYLSSFPGIYVWLPPPLPANRHLVRVVTRRVEVFLFRKDLGTTRQFSLQGRSDTVNPQAGDQLRPASVSVTCTSAPDA